MRTYLLCSCFCLERSALEDANPKGLEFRRTRFQGTSLSRLYDTMVFAEYGTTVYIHTYLYIGNSQEAPTVAAKPKTSRAWRCGQFSAGQFYLEDHGT